jgi:hypothetical protein
MRLLVLLALLGLAGWLVIRPHRSRLLLYLFHLRFPMLTGAALVAIAPTALWGAPFLLENLLALSPYGILFVSCGAVLLSWVVMITAELVLRYGDERFELPTLTVPGRVRKNRIVLFALLAAPLVVAVVLVSPSPFCREAAGMSLDLERLCSEPGPRLAAVALTVKGAAAAVGIALAWGALFLGTLFHAGSLPVADRGADLLLPLGRKWIRRCLPAVRVLARAERFALRQLHRALALVPRLFGHVAGERLVRGWRAVRGDLFRGYFDAETGRVRAGQRLASVLFLSTLGVYLLGYVTTGPTGLGIPALAYLLVLLILLGWALPGLSFFLDRYRVPTLLPLVLFSYLTHWASTSDHIVRLETGPTQIAAAPTPALAQEAREANQLRFDLPRSQKPAAIAPVEPLPDLAEPVGPFPPPVVLVAASGGGITASLWTTRVLTGLQQEVGEEFTRSIRLVSAVSGGSVGTLFFLDRFDRRGCPPAADLDGIVAAAGSSSLEAVGWGIVYPDLFRAFFGLVPFDPARDRGWALEQAWRRHLRHPEASLVDWQTDVAEGWRPAAVFNATVAETGEQFLFTPLDWPKSPRVRPTRSFLRTFPRHDLEVVTAARLSATFPWVSPLARPVAPDANPAPIPSFHLGDGGYFDNFGVDTLVDWLRALGPAELEQLRSRDVVIVLIRAFPQPAGETELAANENSGWIYAAAGPVMTLLRARGTTQSVRGSAEVELILEKLQAQHINANVVVFELGRRGPLSWKLTPEERAEILNGWNTVTVKNAVREVQRLFGRP